MKMPDQSLPASSPAVDPPAEAAEPPAPPTVSFAEQLSEFEQTHSHRSEGDGKQLQGAVVSMDAEFVYLDIGYKTEGVLPRSAFANRAEDLHTGSVFAVSVTGRNPEGYYELSLLRVAQPTDWTSLERAFAQKTPVAGMVTGVVKGGLSVDLGVRAFLPASRSGTRDAAEMEQLVGQQIACRITKLDTLEEDVVVDRRSVLEEEALALQQSRVSALHEGAIVQGTVRSFAPYGAFIDLGGIDGLLHISDMAWSRVSSAEDILSLGQSIELKVLSVAPETRRISLGLKQLQPEPWTSAAERYQAGRRVTGTVTRLLDFGAFVELEPGIEGLIHVSEMSWVKKVRKPSDLLKPGDNVEAMILAVNTEEKRISLGLKQALGDPWNDVPQNFPVGAVVQGQVTRLMKFGAFVQLAEGVEGLLHISEITAERRIHHPQDVLRVGETVKAQIVGLDVEKRQMRLSIKQLAPSGLSEYLQEHRPGDLVSGRVVSIPGADLTAEPAIVELGEGVRARCFLDSGPAPTEEAGSAAADLSRLTSLLSARWKGGATFQAKPEPLAPGQIRSFRILKLDIESQSIELQLA
ncbi:MAG: S1 RNA-binding domain-containing protein [Acidobacteriota bacterium]